MSFGHPYIAFLLLLVASLPLFFLLVEQKKKKVLMTFAQKDLLPKLISSLDQKRRRIKRSMIFIASILCVVALMMPQVGFYWEEAKRTGLDILIAIDTSKSMLAEDSKPNRIGRAKAMVKDFIKRLNGDRIGLIAFSGTAFLVCPLTSDYNVFMLSLDSLNTETIPKGGTSISLAMKEAFKGYRGGVGQYKALVILSDGENHEGDPMSIVEKAQQEGLKIFCIGLGTKEGELIPIADEMGSKVFLKDKEGRVVKTQLNEALLNKIALNTGGSYLREDERKNGLLWIYEEKLSKMEKGEFEGKMRKHHRECFQIPLIFALFLLVFEPMIGEEKKEEKRGKREA